MATLTRLVEWTTPSIALIVDRKREPHLPTRKSSRHPHASHNSNTKHFRPALSKPLRSFRTSSA